MSAHLNQRAQRPSGGQHLVLDVEVASADAIIERPDGSYLGVPNVARLSPDGAPDWIAGLGTSVEEALEDTLRWFVRSAGMGTDTTEQDFVWAAPEDF